MALDNLSKTNDAGATRASESPAERAAQVKPHEDKQPQHLPVKLYRTDDLVTVAAPMPGLGPSDIAVIVSPEGRLVIVGRLCRDDDATACGTLKQPRKESLVDEWDVGPYRRELDLPVAVDGQAATITYGNGILVVALPVAHRTTPARLTLENVSTHLRAGRAGRPNRRLGGFIEDARGFFADAPTVGGAALLGCGAAMLFALGRRPTRRSLLGLAGAALAPGLASGFFAPALMGTLRGAWRSRGDGGDAAKPVSARAAENPVEEASWESFPASDPPSFTGTRARAFD